ncbi:rhomboid family intramembrane serine protease [Bacteroidia bacterium]|nr:rhomboid family intramembrane serine protease [Bacteroidia bacterium]GHU82157.1 rhomboid family intramembrane serine protease [Bacteroidia bacterium]
MMNGQNAGFFSSIPVVTRNLLIINVIFWLASITLPRIGIDLVEFLGLHIPGAVHFNPIQFVSYMFMHDTHSITHLFFNMFAIYMFGRILEMEWGPKRFLIFYLITGVGAGLVQELTWLWSLRDVIFAPIEMVNTGAEVISKKEFLDYFVTIGASGAVFGILLAFGMKFPNIPLYIMFIPIPVKAKYVVIGYGLIELFAGIIQVNGDSVAHFAHLGGMLFGYLLMLYWKKKDGRVFH